MSHPIYRVTGFEIIGPHQLRVTFDDGLTQEIDFKPILKGQMFGPLKDVDLFNQVRLDREVHTLVWPTGADLDPATLHDWPSLISDLEVMARQWEKPGARAS